MSRSRDCSGWTAEPSPETAGTAAYRFSHRSCTSCWQP